MLQVFHGYLRRPPRVSCPTVPVLPQTIPPVPYTKDMNNTPSNNPYVNHLVEMGYDRQDCEMVAAAGQEKTFPCVIHGRTFDTKDQYDQDLHDYLNGL